MKKLIIIFLLTFLTPFLQHAAATYSLSDDYVTEEPSPGTITLIGTSERTTA